MKRKEGIAISPVDVLEHTDGGKEVEGESPNGEERRKRRKKGVYINEEASFSKIQ